MQPLGLSLRRRLRLGRTRQSGRPYRSLPRTAPRALFDSEELACPGDAIRGAEATGIAWEIDEAKPTAKHIPKENRVTALRLLILTGARLREILGLEWDYVDFEGGLLLLPDSTTGRKTIVLNAPGDKGAG